MPADNSRPFSRIVGYVRVSTKMQGASGLGLEAQEAAIRRYAAQVGADVLVILREVESGKRSDRPVLAEAIRQCELKGAALVAAKIDRFGRKAADLFKLRDARFPVIAVDTPNADGFLFGILALVAERERETISQRTSAALAAAKARGVDLGKPENLRNAELGRERGRATNIARSVDRAAKLRPEIEALRAGGAVSLRQLAAGLNARGIQTERGGQWSAVQVARLLARLSERTPGQQAA